MMPDMEVGVSILVLTTTLPLLEIEPWVCGAMRERIASVIKGKKNPPEGQKKLELRLELQLLVCAVVTECTRGFDIGIWFPGIVFRAKPLPTDFESHFGTTFG